MNACDEGEHKNLDCDSDTYQSECLADNSYMFCRDGVLTVMECGTTYVCRESETTGQDGTVTKSAACKPFDDVAAECASNDDCKDASKPVCSNGTCVADSTPAAECASNDDCKDASKPVCSNGTCVADSTPAAECASNDDCKDASKPVCSNGTCVADSTPAAECASNDDCKDASKPVCSNGTCVADQSDNSCGEDFVERCDGNSAVYCSGGKVKTYACGEDTVCLVSGTSKIADCYEKDESVCTNIGEKSVSCESMGWYGDVTSTYQCEELSDGTKRLVGIEFEQCDFACNADGNACAIATEDGKTCTTDAKAYCTTNEYDECAIYDGEVMCYASGDVCTDENEVSYACNTDYWGDDVSVTTSCKRMADGTTLVNVATSESCDLTCNAADGKCEPITDNGKTCNYAATNLCTANDYDSCALVGGELTCYYNSEKCQNIGAEANVCDTSWATWGIYSSVKNVCTLADDGATKLYVAEDAEYCDEICDTATGLCAADEAVEGECSTAMTATCEAYGYKGCALVGGSEMCHDGTCTQKDDVKNTCDEYQDSYYAITLTCVEADNGNLVLSYDEEECANGCNEDNTECKKLVDDEGSECDEEGFVERCDGNTVVYCYDEVVTAFSCDGTTDDGETAACYVSSGANYSDCYADSDLESYACTIPSTKTVCDDSGYYGHDALLTYSCAKFETADGTKTANLYYMSDGVYCVNDEETAYTVCNADKTACSDVLEDDAE